MSIASGKVLLAAAQAPGNVVPERAQMAGTLGFHIILACFGIALPSTHRSTLRISFASRWYCGAHTITASATRPDLAALPDHLDVTTSSETLVLPGSAPSSPPLPADAGVRSSFMRSAGPALAPCPSSP